MIWSLGTYFNRVYRLASAKPGHPSRSSLHLHLRTPCTQLYHRPVGHFSPAQHCCRSPPQMAVQCIVCLTELKAQSELRTLLNASSPRPDGSTECSEDEEVTQKRRQRSSRSLIACILPCRHQMHNGCLEPWVERANSCPICRQNFNAVELSSTVDGKRPRAHMSSVHSSRLMERRGHVGPVISSYVVEDRVQMAEVEPFNFDHWVCVICEDGGAEDQLLVCDGCDASSHTFCLGLESVPPGEWYCDDCSSQHTWGLIGPSDSVSPRRERTQGNRQQRDGLPSASSWSRVWQLVWDRLNLDLDSPFNDDPSVAHYRQSRSDQAQQRREFEQWQRRFEVGQRQGGPTSRFRDTKPALLESEGQRGDAPSESKEEQRAWRDLEKARELESTAPGKRKRRSATNSPTDPPPENQPERKLKRPKTRRAREPAMQSHVLPTPLSSSAATSPTRPTTAERQVKSRSVSEGRGPSFLQSLLREAGSSITADVVLSASGPAPALTSGSSDDRGSSPDIPIKHTTPRANTTRSSPSSTRPGSPLPLTSKVEPVFPAPEFSQSCSPLQTNGASTRPATSQIDQRRDSATTMERTRSMTRPRSTDHSPSRRDMSPSAKSDISKMVQAALKPFYHNGTLSKENYTVVNRDVSRMLYDLIGDVTRLDGQNRKCWEDIATTEVRKAVESLRAA